MTLEVHLGGTHILVSLKLLHGIEVTTGQLVLIGDIEIPSAQLIAHTEATPGESSIWSRTPSFS